MKKYHLLISNYSKKYIIYELTSNQYEFLNFRKIYSGDGFSDYWTCSHQYYRNDLKENYIVAENDNLEELKQQIYLELL